MVALLQILGFILKLVGLLLLGILCLLLLILLLVLCVPLRYRVRLQKAEQLAVTARFGWLAWLIYARIMYRPEEGLCYRLRLFGIPVLDSTRVKTPRQLEKAARRAEKRAKKAAAAEAEKAKAEAEKAKTDSRSGADENTGGTAEPEKNADGKALTAEGNAGGTAEPEKNADGKALTAEENAGRAAEPEKSADGKALTTEENADGTAEPTTDGNTGDAAKKTAFGRFFSRIKAFFTGTLAKLRAIPEKLRGLWKKLHTLLHKLQTIAAFIADEENRAAFKGIGKAGKQLICYILPTYLSGTVVFGTGDPYSTGKAMAALGVAYPLYGQNLSVTPDFLEKRLEADIFFKGRIRMGRLLFIAVRLYFSQWFKQFMARVRVLKAALS